ncbi:MAG TPA: hypothetical protein VEC16_05735 [Alphaproteobacteria bacterium]|nr:hypothetical protein [Alphaproteobacteria bacterium]
MRIRAEVLGYGLAVFLVGGAALFAVLDKPIWWQLLIVAAMIFLLSGLYGKLSVE